MSEFKFACPVCGQHMMCDASHGGSVMECPTCYQKIVAPQAPAADAKFILTGTKLSEKKIHVRGLETVVAAAAAKKFPFALLLALALAGAATAGLLMYRAKNAPKVQPVSEKTVLPAKPAMVAPPANDTNWLLNLDAVTIPPATAAGRIHGQDFIVERAGFQNGTLTLRAGTRGSVELGVLIRFPGAQPESLAGQSINISPDAEKAAPVSLRWKDADGRLQKENHDTGYALRLEFGALQKNRLPGKIYLCTPDSEKSYLMGTFNADAHKPKPKAPTKK